MTKLLPPPANEKAADRARSCLEAFPPEVAKTTDHLAVLRFAGHAAPQDVLAVDKACTAAEVEAAARSVPVYAAIRLARNSQVRGQRVAVVSNNSAHAVKRFLERVDLHLPIFGRPEGFPDLMKPNPHLIRKAIDALEVDAEDALIVGDSVTDIEAAHAVGIVSIGLVTRESKRASMLAGAADAYVDSMDDLVT